MESAFVRPGRRWGTLLLGVWALAATAAALGLAWRLWWGAAPPAGGGTPASEPRDRLVLVPAAFDDLPGWRAEPLTEAVPPFLASCDALGRWPDERRLAAGPRGVGGSAGDWRGVCRAAAALPPGDETAARVFFEANFRVLAVHNGEAAEGLFTGYYEPSLRGSRRRHGPYRTPLYLRPPELVSVDLGLFRDDLAGRRLAGRVRGGTLEPFDDRAAIDRGALAGRGLEMVWVDDAVDAFFLQIQGSGRIELDDGGSMRVGYAAQNGHPYVAIGRELVERGELAVEEVSLQSIREWLRRHPEEAEEVMYANPSYVFFRELPGPGPLGSLGVPLTPERSLAVDRTFLPLGAPVWVATTLPAVPEAFPEGAPEVPWSRLLMAQDTGGAIRGPVRGDIFWGHGEDAEAVAGRMRQPGRMWLLLPRPIRPSTAPRRRSPPRSRRRPG
jgi:membrane-bound lytic murein transglycosylase A